MSRIRHIAILAADPAELSEFYKTAFGLKEVARSGDNGEAIYLSDGHINLVSSSAGEKSPQRHLPL